VKHKIGCEIMPEYRTGRSVLWGSYKRRGYAELIKKNLENKGYPKVRIVKYKNMWDVRYA